MSVLSISRGSVPYSVSFLLPFSCDEWAQRPTLMGAHFSHKYFSSPSTHFLIFHFSAQICCFRWNQQQQVDAVLMSDEWKAEAGCELVLYLSCCLFWARLERLCCWGSISPSVITPLWLFVRDLWWFFTPSVILLMTYLRPALVVCPPELAIKFTFYLLPSVFYICFRHK